MSHLFTFKLPLAGLITAVLATPVGAATLEERLKAYLDGLKAKGQAVAPLLGSASEVRQPTLTMRTDNLPMGADLSVVFVSNGCGSCTQVAATLKRRLGSVEVLNISTSQTAREAYAATGAKGVPAILIGKRLITGYSDALLDRAVVDDIQDKSSTTLTGGGA
jgi:glutaredoxin